MSEFLQYFNLVVICYIVGLSWCIYHVVNTTLKLLKHQYEYQVKADKEFLELLENIWGKVENLR